MNGNIKKIADLRELMAHHGIDTYIILTDDFHASEYVNEFFKCREYISSFSGSAGTLVVTAEDACLWTDGRYFLQAAEQLRDGAVKLMKMNEPGVPAIIEYLKANVKEGSTVGYDGRTVNAGFAIRLKKTLNAKFIENVDLVGDMWDDRPAFPASPVWELSADYTGTARSEKLAELRENIKKYNADSLLLASLDDIAWLYNLRGSDVKNNPVFMSYSIVNMDNAVIYAAPEAFSAELTEKLKADGVTVKPYFDAYKDITALKDGSTLLLEKDKVNIALLNSVPKTVHILSAVNPTTLPKAIKTEREMENIRKAHIQDGVAVTKLLYWLRELEKAAELESCTELDIAEKLAKLRAERPGFVDLSFESIIAAGSNGAIVHYSPDEKSNAHVVKDSFLLMDTGGQYYEGTTDITRTIATGELTYEQKLHYTAVLRGNLDLAMTKFRYGCGGEHLDAICRAPLWELGLDYNHGTGHGVGYLLNVHEGPQRIRWAKGTGTDAPMEHGMLTSDEPGIYLEGRYGIRLENLMLTLNYSENENGRFMCFETVTMVPFDRRAILKEELSARELRFLNEYHKKIYETISPYLTAEESAWLKEETREI